MHASGARVYQLGLPEACAHGTFFPPTLIEIARMGELRGEVFGPILHVLRFREGELAGLIADINATGFGLTHGIQTRIDETVDAICARVRAGNIYVNRNMIGAVVGVQPFGGEGLSGTGPKAGGPHYLRRLVAAAPPSSAAQVASSLTLPGPTGETNTLSLVPRGRVGCIADRDDALEAQLRLVGATRNVAVLATEAHERLAARLGVRCERVPDVLAAPLEAVLFAGSAERAREARVALAAREGAIVALIRVDAEHTGDPLLLLSERTISINTTASGGNASLLSLME
jgi:RHH-type proline utilization regulon transcriptional repressor/proline dehydrogenase/delta 1-pyrroline-5-carboxylate dehydrogenase